MSRKSKTTGKEEPTFDESWKTLSLAFSQIHSKNASTLSFEELFRSAYKLVLKKQHQDLYNRVVEFERAWLSTNVKTRVASQIAPTILIGASGQSADTQANERRLASERFMTSLKDAYNDQSLSMNMITDVLMYMVSPSLPVSML